LTVQAAKATIALIIAADIAAGVAANGSVAAGPDPR
jgi:hypothetical protein